MNYLNEIDKTHTIRSKAIFAGMTLVIGIAFAIFVFIRKGGNR